MKKLIFIALMFSTLTIAMGQDKGSYITVGGDLGWTKFFYDLDEGSSRGKLGYGGNIGYQYFFSPNWGIGVKAEFFVFNTQSRYQNRLFTFEGQVDDLFMNELNEPTEYELDVTLRNWRENQKTSFFNIPLMLLYQTRFGQSKNVGMYGGIGAKAQFPIKSTYKRNKGNALLLAYYPDYNMRIVEEFPLPSQHGFGSNGNLNWKGDNELKFGVAVTGELGFLFALSRRVDLTVGVSADYGLMDIKDKSVELLYPTGSQQRVDYIGQNLAYNGILNSQEINKNHPFALKGELGLRIKIGKLTEKRGKKSEDKQDEIIELLRGLANRPADTIILNPTIEVTFPEEYFDRISSRRDADSNTLDGVPVADIEILMEPVFFDLNQSVLRRDAKETLDRKMDMLRRHDQVRLTIVGHTCDLGSYKHNYELSRRRAETVRSYLISNGIRPSRLTIVPEGMNNPMNPNDTEQHRQLNRQVNFIVGK